MLQKLENLIDQNHLLLNELGVGHSSLDTLVAIAAKHGLHGKLTGAGGGGCGYVLLHPTNNQIQELKQEFEKCNFECFDTGIGGPGVLVFQVKSF